MHDISLITTIAFGLTAALICGLIVKRFGLSPIVGYLAAGVVLGPYTPGFVGNVELAKQLAEIGVILLMFGVGLHFHLDDLLKVKSIAIPGALGQSAMATVFAMGIAVWAGWGMGGGAVLGVAVSVASTVVLLRVLMDHNLVETGEGRVAVGWLVVEDIITVLVLVLLPALAVKGGAGGEGAAAMPVWQTAGIAVLKLAALGAVMAFVGARFVPWLLLKVARLRSRELFTLTVLVIAMAVATVGYITFGASMALGAFLAGMVVGQSKVSHQAAADALPMRDAFAVLFFVSVGMLFDPRAILTAPWLILGMLLVVLIVKPIAAMLIVLVSGHSLRTGLTVAGGLAQIGEFSFILGEMARTYDLMPDEGHHALVACAIVSISLNPWLFKSTLELEGWIKKKPKLYALLNRRVEKLGRNANAPVVAELAKPSVPRALVVGYGPVGRTVARRAEECGIEPVVIDSNVDTVLALQAEGKKALYGDASRSDILKEAGIAQSSYLLVTIPDSSMSTAVVLAAKQLKPDIKVLARARYLAQGGALEEAGADAVSYDEAETATALAVVLKAHLKSDSAAKAAAAS